MNKPPYAVYERFAARFAAATARAGKPQYLLPYYISSHPGSSLDHAIELALALKKQGLFPEQVQDFYPTPGTLSTCMYYTRVNPLTNQPVYVADTAQEKAMQRALLQVHKKQNWPLVRAALRRAGREDLIGIGRECLVPEEPPRRDGRPDGDFAGRPDLKRGSKPGAARKMQPDMKSGSKPSFGGAGKTGGEAGGKPDLRRGSKPDSEAGKRIGKPDFRTGGKPDQRRKGTEMDNAPDKRRGGSAGFEPDGRPVGRRSVKPGRRSARPDSVRGSKPDGGRSARADSARGSNPVGARAVHAASSRGSKPVGRRSNRPGGGKGKRP